MVKPTAILTADWHIRDTRPICRTDDYMLAQETKLRVISNLVVAHQIPIFFAGDFFDKPKVSDYLKIWLIENDLIEDRKTFFAIAGNHDLPNHNIDLLYKSSLGLMEAGDFLTVLKEYTRLSDGYSVQPFHWNQEIKNSDYPINENKRNIALAHYLTYKRRKPFPGCQTRSAIDLLKKFDSYDLIVTGDNHKSFSVEYEGRLLVNPGSIMRMDADQIDHKPRVALWYAEDNHIEWIELPIEQDVISREHIEIQQDRDERMEAFVSRLNADYNQKPNIVIIDGKEYLVYPEPLSFEQNLKRFFKSNRTRSRVQDIVWEIVEESKDG